jgi:hypothetical protein
LYRLLNQQKSIQGLKNVNKYLLTRLRLLLYFTLYILRELWRFSTFKPYTYTLYGSGSVSNCVNPAPQQHIWFRLRPTLYSSGSVIRQTDLAPHQLVWGLLHDAVLRLRSILHGSGSALTHTSSSMLLYTTTAPHLSIWLRLHPIVHSFGSALPNTTPAPGYHTRLPLRVIVPGSRPVMPKLYNFFFILFFTDQSFTFFHKILYFSWILW